MMNKYKILIIEDELHICNFVKTVLETNGYRAIDANRGATGWSMFCSHQPNLIILDLGLPDMDGTDFIKKVREQSDVPILVLSARTREEDKIEALDLGANDYVTKPFGTGELLARVRAILRNSRNKDISASKQQNIFQTSDLLIEYNLRRVSVGGNEVKLTQTEYNIVEYLSLHVERVLTYAEIIKKIWGYSDSGSVKKLQVNMANIRKKLGEKPGENRYILNELGIGYRIKEISEEDN